LVSSIASSPPRDKLSGVLIMLLAVLLFSCMDALIKLASARYPTGQIIFFRNAFAFLPLSFFIRRAGGLKILRTRHFKQHLLRAVFGITSMGCGFLSFALMPLADSVAIGMSAPIFLTAVSVPLLGEKVGWRRWAAVIVGFLGILIITRPGMGVFGAGALLALAGSLLYAFAIVQIRKMPAGEPAATTVFFFSLIATGVGGASLPWQWVTPGPLMLACLIVIGLIGGLAQMALTVAYRIGPVSIVAPFEYTGLLFATGFGFAIWGQVPDRFVFLGAVVVIASGLYILHRERVRMRELPVSRTSETGH
jgi:drug/metabolite transporter (DMT)-like permease